MRTSILSRSVIAVATLGIGSVALAATPATAATSSGVTRDMVLTAANGLRIAEPTEEQATSTSAAVREIFRKGCGVPAGTEEFIVGQAEPTQAGDDADGVLLSGFIYATPMRPCAIAVVATTDPAFQLSGTVNLSTQMPSASVLTEPLSGDVYATTPTTTAFGLTLTASGNATKTVTVSGTKKVADKKSKAQKKAAKSKYDKRIKAAKKKYAKALDKAGRSKSKKVAAKKAYSAAHASAKAKYRSAIAGYRIVKTTVSKTENRPFSISADGSNFVP